MKAVLVFLLGALRCSIGSTCNSQTYPMSPTLSFKPRYLAEVQGVPQGSGMRSFLPLEVCLSGLFTAHTHPPPAQPFPFLAGLPAHHPKKKAWALSNKAPCPL